MIKHLKYLAILLTLALTPGCTEDKPVVKEAEILKTVDIMFGVEKVETAGVSTRSAAGSGLDVGFADPTRAGKDDDEVPVNDVWILQFNGAGALAATPVYITQTGLTSSPYHGFTCYTTSADLVAGRNTTVYIIANLDDPARFVGSTLTLGQFEGGTLTFLTKDAIEQEASQIMVGCFRGDIPEKGKPEPLTWVHRIAARLKLDLTYDIQIDGGDFTPETIQLQSVPTVASYYDGQGASAWRFPSPSAANFIDYPMEAITGSGSSYIWYVTENLRGINSAVGHQWYKYRANEPDYAANGNVSYGTRIVMKGTYYKAVSTGTMPEGRSVVTVTIYPGMNETTDYNIRRNHSYDMQANITTLLNGTDMRVEVETGPVVRYTYYYENGDTETLFATDFDANVATGTYTPTDAWINKYHADIPDKGNNFGPGVATPSSLNITADSENTVKVLYPTAPGTVGYTITYHPNGASVGQATSFNVPAGGEHHLVPVFILGFSRPGWVFFGWNIVPDGSGFGYTGAETITMNSDIDLYAVWSMESR